MNRLTLRDWAAMAEIAGTIGVVVSLLMVVYSLNQNTVAISGSGVNEIYDGYRSMQIAMIENPEMAMIVKKGATDHDSLSEMEQELYILYVSMNLDLWDRMINRESEGLIDPASSEPWHLFFQEWTRRHVSRELWAQQKWGWPTERFQKQVEALLDH
jgi:hypothetical protein